MKFYVFSVQTAVGKKLFFRRMVLLYEEEGLHVLLYEEEGLHVLLYEEEGLNVILYEEEGLYVL